MADVNDIVGLGFGSWSSVNSIPTLGFGIGEAVLVSQGSLQWDVDDQLLQWDTDNKLLEWD